MVHKMGDGILKRGWFGQHENGAVIEVVWRIMARPIAPFQGTPAPLRSYVTRTFGQGRDNQYAFYPYIITADGCFSTCPVPFMLLRSRKPAYPVLAPLEPSLHYARL